MPDPVIEMSRLAQGASTDLVFARTLYAHTLPAPGEAGCSTASPTVGISIGDGLAPTRVQGSTASPAWTHPRFEFVVRSTAPADGRWVNPSNALGLAWKIHHHLETLTPTSSTGGTYSRVAADGTPRTDGRDAAGHYHYSFTVTAWRTSTA